MEAQIDMHRQRPGQRQRGGADRSQTERETSCGRLILEKSHTFLSSVSQKAPEPKLDPIHNKHQRTSDCRRYFHDSTPRSFKLSEEDSVWKSSE